MIRDLMADLLRLEMTNERGVTDTWQETLAELQREINTGLQVCRVFFGLAAGESEDEPGAVEPMTAAQLLARKRQSVAVVEALAGAMRAMGAPLGTDLDRLRTVLERQIERLAAQPDPVPSGDWWLAPGYRLEKVIGGLVYPTSLAFDDDGCLYVFEGGFSYPTAAAVARVLRLDPSGPVEIARGFRGPATSLTWHQGSFYIAEGATPARSPGSARTARRGPS